MNKPFLKSVIVLFVIYSFRCMLTFSNQPWLTKTIRISWYALGKGSKLTSTDINHFKISRDYGDNLPLTREGSILSHGKPESLYPVIPVISSNGYLKVTQKGRSWNFIRNYECDLIVLVESLGMTASSYNRRGETLNEHWLWIILSPSVFQKQTNIIYKQILCH